MHVESGHMDKIRILGNIANRKPILQYHKDGNFIKKWDSIKEAANELKLSTSSISKVCKGNRMTCGGYTFKYKED